jgi:hypothetical protein
MKKPGLLFLNGNVDGDATITFDHFADLYIDKVGFTDPNAPIFFGSYDWHSSVHAHLVNAFAYEAAGDMEGLADFVAARFSAEKVQGEIDYIAAGGTAGSRDVYGFAWFLQLDLQLRENGFDNLKPLAEFLAQKASDSVENMSGYGWHNDPRWIYANLYNWAVKTGDTALAETTLNDYRANENKEPLSDSILVDVHYFDFFSNPGLSAFTHVMMGVTDTANYQNVYDVMLKGVTDGA